MRLLDLLAAALVAGLRVVNPPERAAPSPAPRRVFTGFRPRLEELHPRELPATVIPLGDLAAVTAIDVLDGGTVQAVGYRLDAATGLRTGRLLTVSPAGQVTAQTLGGGLNVEPIAISNGRAVGSYVTGSPAGTRGIGWNLADPATGYDLGEVPGTDGFTFPFALNASGVWVGSDAGLAAISGQLFSGSLSVIPTPPGNAFALDIADNGSVVVDCVTFSGKFVRVYRPDNTFVELVNPFASDPFGSTVMFGDNISEDGTKVLANVERYNPAAEAFELVPVVFSGPNFSQWTAPTLPGGGTFFGDGVDVEDSGLVTIKAAGGLYLWQPGQTPQKLNALLDLGFAATTFGAAFNAGNTTFQKGGLTYIASTSAAGTHLIVLGEPTPTDPPAVITGSAAGETIVVDLSQYLTTPVITVNALGGNDVIRIVGTAGRPVRVVVNAGGGDDRVYFEATGPVTAEVNLGAGNDLFDGRSGRWTALTVRGYAGNDTIFGSAVSGTTLFGDAGNDVIVGGAGDDEIHTGSGVNLVYSGRGRDRIFSDSRLDFVFADADDELWGNPLFVFGRPRRRF